MADEKIIKAAKGKLYNFKNGVEGLFPLLDSGVVTIDRLPDAVASLSAKFVEDIQRLDVPPVI